MIVSMNKANSDSYIALFSEACEALKAANYQIDKGRFDSFAEYYSHMADFFNEGLYKYVMMPIDEESFKIDLNTRTIEVPQSFSKCASVQSDQLAETIIFIVDRYFDYMDLANTEIFVQWTLPENKKTGFAGYNGATRVEMIDLESEPGKIKFAWPLNDQITEVAGTVKFSVRFFRVDDSSPNKLLYSLNTTDKEITIKEALQPTLNAEHYVEKPINDESFKRAILNSLYADKGVVPPVQPVYFEPGSNIDADTLEEINDVKIVSLNENDTITLRVQAAVADAGEITYKWYYKSDDSEELYDCEHYPVFDAEGKIVEDSFTTFGTVEDVYVPVEPTARVAHERYYVTEDNGASYKLYVDVIPPVENIQLYERYSTFTVPADVKITGEYQAAAWNTISVPNSNKVLTTLYPTRSDVCVLPGPAKIAFKENGNLVDGKILIAQGEGDEKVFTAQLAVDIVKDNYNPVVKYEWRKSLISAEDAVDLTHDAVETSVPTLDVTEPGWYSVNVISTLNRTTEEKLSVDANNAPKACKVTFAPEPPVVQAQPIGGSIVGYVNKAPVTFRVDASINNPDEMADLLLSDKISYVWQIAYTDTNETYINIPENFAGVSGLGTHAITVTEKLKTSVANFRCLVINELNGAKAIFDHSGAYVSDGTLGDFKEEAPYRYEDAALNYIFTAVNF